MLQKKLIFLQKRFLCANYIKQNSTNFNVIPFEIPYKKKRSPTSLLEVLAKTIKIDVTAPHFSLIDDPATIPTSISRKKHYYLCKEFGKRAARQLTAEWPTLFLLDHDQPRLPIFRIEKPLDPLIIDINEENLLKMIEKKQVEDALKLYERIQLANIDILEDTKIKLFQLICYYNGKNVPINEIAEWHGLRNFFENNITIENRNEIAVNLFRKIPKTAENYSTLICNLLKFSTSNSITQAQNLLKEMINKNYTPSEEVFNFFILNQVSLINSQNYEVCEELKYMAKHNVLPSIKTFNAALHTLLTIPEVDKRWQLAKGLISELEKCCIKCNLTTYKILIDLLSQKLDTKNWDLSTKVLNAILCQLENVEKIKIAESTDENFFISAIELASQLQSSDLIERVNKLYCEKKNGVQFSSFISEIKFFREYLFYKARTMSIEKFESVYISHVPRVTSLSTSLAFLIFKKLKQIPLWSFTKRVIEDCITIGHISNYAMSKEWQDLLINFPTKKLSKTEFEEYKELINTLINAWTDVNKLNNFLQNQKTKNEELEFNSKNDVSEETKKTQRYKNECVRIDFENFQTALIEKKIF